MAEEGQPGKGRPTKRTPERADVILRAVRTGMTMRAAAGLADMHVSSLYAWQEEDPTFSDALAHAHAECEARFTTIVTDDALGRPAQHDDRGRVIRAEVKPNVESAKWWLEHRRKEDYARHVQIDVMSVARKVAEETGLEVSEVLAEAERIIGGENGD